MPRYTVQKTVIYEIYDEERDDYLDDSYGGEEEAQAWADHLNAEEDDGEA